MKKTTPLFKIFFINLMLLCTYPNTVFAQKSIIYQPKEMQADLIKLKNILIKTHPGLYTHQSPKEFEKLMDNLVIEVSIPMEALSFYKIVLKLVANIHDGHTDAIAFNKLGEIISNQKRIPFQVYVKDLRIFIVKNMSSASIPEGSEILSIDNSSNNEIILKILEHYSSDGKSLVGMEHYLGVSYRSFNKIYPIIYGEKPSYNITYRDYITKQIVTTKITAISKEQYKANELKKYKYESKKFTKEAFFFDINKTQDYAYLKISRFFKDSSQEPKNTYPDYYKKCFEKIFNNDIKNLIIDLRDNDGGKASNAAYLLQYLIEKPLIPAKEVITLGNNVYFLKITGDTLYLDQDFDLVQKKNGNFKVTKTDILRELEVFNPIEKHHFKGKIIVLIDGGVVSAGATAAGLLKEYTNATFVGSETFGYAGISNGVNKIYAVGRDTQTAIAIPIMHAEYKIDKNLQKRGVVPDYQISSTIDDIINKTDVVLEFVFKKILYSKN
ncbi:MAG: S41 family peptidase [Opitutaceae bacterium]|nr:S41 family peptidase [Opitutaceae bacterium]